MQDKPKTTDNIDWKAVVEMQARLVKEKFNIDLSGEVLPVRDGCVCKESSVWWASEEGPEYVYARTDWDNIRNFPQFYSVDKPRYKITYLD